MLKAYGLRGKIIDEAGEPLPGVSIYVEQTSYGVASNFKGEFTMELLAGEYTLVFRILGYEEQRVEVRVPYEGLLLVQMKERVTELNEVVISAKSKDPAYAIMKMASEHRKNYVRQFEQISYRGYLKASLEKEYTEKQVDSTTNKKVKLLTKEKMNLVEKLSDFHYRAPDDRKEVIIAYKNYSDKPEHIRVNESLADYGFYVEMPDVSEPMGDDAINPLLFYTSPLEDDFNFYKAQMYLPGVYDHPYISPLHPLATASYKFRLVESFREDGQLIHKIELTSRRAKEAIFSGHIFIVDGLWAIKAVDVRFSRAANFTFPKMQLAQNYQQLNDGRWVCVREEFFYETGEPGITYIGNTVVKYSEFNIEPEFGKRFFNNEITTFSPDAEKNAEQILANQRPITLKVEEIEFVVTQDSINKAHLASDYLMQQDSSFNHFSIGDIFFTGIRHRNSAKGRYFSIIPFFAQIRLYQPGGYRHALGGQYSKFYKESGKQLDIFGEASYGLLNKDPRGKIRTSYTYNNFNFSKVTVGLGSEYELMNQNPTAVANFSPNNYSLTNHFTLGYAREIVNGLFIDGEVRYAQHNPITDLEYPFDLDTFEQGFRDFYGDDISLTFIPEYFDPYSKALFDLNFIYRHKQLYKTYPNRKVIMGSKYPKLGLRIRSGIPGILGSSAAFLYTELRIQDRMNIGAFGYSQYNVQLGSFLWKKDVQIVDERYINGGEIIFYSSPMRSFQLMGPSLSTTEPFLEAHYRHLFDGAILNKVPALRVLRLGLMGGINGLWMAETGFAHIEAYAGLEKKFSLWSATMKAGVYVINASSNQLSNRTQVKFGITVYDPITRRWYGE